MNISATVTLTPDSKYSLGRATMTFEDKAAKFAFMIKNITIHQSQTGNLFVRFPSEKTNRVDEAGRAIYSDVCLPTTAETRSLLTKLIINAYTMEYQKAQMSSVVLGEHQTDNSTQMQNDFYESIDEELVL